MNPLDHLLSYPDTSMPLITSYGEQGRIELSVASAANWVSKMAGYFSSLHPVPQEGLIVLHLDDHWLSWCTLLGALSSGVAVVCASEVREQWAQEATCVVSVTAADGINRCSQAYPDADELAFFHPHSFALSLQQQNMDIPAWASDFIDVIRPMPDVFHPQGPATLLNGESIEQAMHRAAENVSHHKIQPQSRWAIGSRTALSELSTWILSLIHSAGSVVLFDDSTPPAKFADTEKVTVVVGDS